MFTDIFTGLNIEMAQLCYINSESEKVYFSTEHLILVEKLKQSSERFKVKPHKPLNGMASISYRLFRISVNHLNSWSQIVTIEEVTVKMTNSIEKYTT